MATARDPNDGILTRRLRRELLSISFVRSSTPSMNKQRGYGSMTSTCAGYRVSSLAEGAGTSYIERKTISDPIHNHTTPSHFFHQQIRIYSRAPNPTRPVVGDPNIAGSTPGSWALKTLISSRLRGNFVQKSVEGVMPLTTSALRGC